MCMQWALLSFAACPVCEGAHPLCHFWFHFFAGLSCFKVLDELNVILPHVSVSLSCFRDLHYCASLEPKFVSCFSFTEIMREPSCSKISHFCLPVEVQVFFFFFWKKCFDWTVRYNWVYGGTVRFYFCNDEGELHVWC